MPRFAAQPPDAATPIFRRAFRAMPVSIDFAAAAAIAKAAITALKAADARCRRCQRRQLMPLMPAASRRRMMLPPRFSCRFSLADCLRRAILPPCCCRVSHATDFRAILRCLMLPPLVAADAFRRHFLSCHAVTPIAAVALACRFHAALIDAAVYAAASCFMMPPRATPCCAALPAAADTLTPFSAADGLPPFSLNFAIFTPRHCCHEERYAFAAIFSFAEPLRCFEAAAIAATALPY